MLITDDHTNILKKIINRLFSIITRFLYWLIFMCNLIINTRLFAIMLYAKRIATTPSIISINNILTTTIFIEQINHV